jgi:uncharacterized protein YbcI
VRLRGTQAHAASLDSRDVKVLVGAARATIATEIVRLQSEYYGKGPTKARVHVDGDVLVVVLEETFTPAERTLIERGEADGIQDIRRRFQRAMAEQFTSIVEQATGRKVRAFFSDTDLVMTFRSRSSSSPTAAPTWRSSSRRTRRRQEPALGQAR